MPVSKSPGPLGVLATLMVCSSGCSDVGGDTRGFVLRDSAGIWIAENSAPSWGDGFAWSVSGEPSLRIGEVEGAEEYQLDRVSDAVRLADGGVAVANAGTEIRVYGPDGRFVRRIGRSGSGPGEFRNLGSIFLSGEALIAGDFVLRRVSTFGPDGELRGSHQMEVREGRVPNIRGRTADGDLIVSYTPVYGSEQVEPGISRIPTWLFRQNPVAGTADSITAAPGFETFVRITEGGGFSVTPRLLGRPLVTAVRDSILAVGGNDRYEIELWGVDGTLKRLIRRNVPGRPVTASMWRQAVDEQLGRIEEAEPAWIEFMKPVYEEMPRPSTLPYYQAVLIDRRMHIWLRNQGLPGESGATWSVFDTDGRWLGDVDMPEGLSVREIGDDYVLGIRSDEMNIEYVQVHDLRRAGR